MRILRPIISILVLGILIYGIYNWFVIPSLFRTAKIVHLIDADSMLVMENGYLRSVQLIGVDAPEKTGNNSSKQCYDEEAKQQVLNMFKLSRDIRLDDDKTLGDSDIYERKLRYVYLGDGTLLNAEILEKGIGKEFHLEDKSYEKMEEFEQLETKAKEEKMGLWAENGCKGNF